MASYSAPTEAYVRELTGINVLIQGEDEASLDQQIANRITSAETEVRILATSSVFEDSGLETHQVDALKQAVAWSVAALVLSRFALEIATGTNAPHLTVSPTEAIKIGDSFRDRAERLARGVATGEGTVKQDSPGYFAEDVPERTFTREMAW